MTRLLSCAVLVLVLANPLLSISVGPRLRSVAGPRLFTAPVVPRVAPQAAGWPHHVAVPVRRTGHARGRKAALKAAPLDSLPGLLDEDGKLAAICFASIIALVNVEKNDREKATEAEVSIKVLNKIIQCKLELQKLPTVIPRDAYMVQLKEFLSCDDSWAVLVFGNSKVGKSLLVEMALQNTAGVILVQLKNGVKPKDLVMAKLGANCIEAVERALRDAEAELRHKATIVFEVPRDMTDISVLQDLNILAKDWGSVQKLVRIIVTASTAATASGFTADGRSHSLFIQHLSQEEMNSTHADKVNAFLQHYGGKSALNAKSKIYYLTGGNIGRMKELAQQLMKTDWAAVEQKYRVEQENLITSFFDIDNYGGFGSEKVPGAVVLATKVSEADYEVGVPRVQAGINPMDFGVAVRNRRAQAIYFDYDKNAYAAVSPAVHELVKKKTPSSLTTRVRRWLLRRLLRLLDGH